MEENELFQRLCDIRDEAESQNHWLLNKMLTDLIRDRWGATKDEV